MRRLSALIDQRRLLGGTVILASTQILASVAGLLRDRILYTTFPSLGITDVYFAAFRPSDFLFQACILSALGTVLVPVLAGERAKGQATEADKILSATIQLGALVFGVMALVLAIVFPTIAPHLVQFQGDQLALYIQFGRMALLSNFLFVFGTTFGQHLIAVQRYWVYGFTPVLYTLCTIAGTVFLTPFYGPMGPMLGTIIGAFLYAVWRGCAVVRTGGVLHPLLFWHPELRRMGMLMLPRLLTLGAFQVQLLAFDFFASGMDRGAVSVNAATRNFQSVVVGAVGIALAQAVYAPLSEASGRADRMRFRHYLHKALRMDVLLTILGSIALVLVAPLAARIVNLTQVLSVFSAMLAIYALSIPFESISHLLLRASYALKDTLLPALSAVLGGAAAIAVAWIFAERYGIYALAAAYTVGEAVQMLGLALALPIKMRRSTWAVRT